MFRSRGNQQTVDRSNGHTWKSVLLVLTSFLGLNPGMTSQSIAEENPALRPRPRTAPKLEKPRTRFEDSSLKMTNSTTSVEYERVDGVGFRPKVSGSLQADSRNLPNFALRPPNPLPESDQKPKAVLDPDSVEPAAIPESSTVQRNEVRRDQYLHQPGASQSEAVRMIDGPAIIPLDKSHRSRTSKSWVRVELQSVPAQVAASSKPAPTELPQTKSTESIHAGEIGRVSGEMTWRKSGVQQSIAYREEDDSVEMTQPVATVETGTESDFPVDKVLELRKRLESAAALNPGEVLRSQPESANGSALTRERPTSRTASRNDVTSAITVAKPTVKVRKQQRRPAVEAEQTEIVPEQPESVRQPIVGKTSFIKWKPVTDGGSSSPEQPRETSKEPVSDLRQSLSMASPSATEPKVPVQAISTEAGPTKYVRSPATYSEPNEFGDVVKSRDLADDRDALVSEPKETRFSGAMLDHAPAPSADNSSTVTVNSEQSAADQWDSSNDAPLPPAALDEDGHQFEHPKDLFKRNRRSRTDRQVALAESQSAVDSASSSDGSSSPDADDDDDESDTDAPKLPAAGTLVERFAKATGVSLSAATSLLTLAPIVTIFAGLWFVRSLVRANHS